MLVKPVRAQAIRIFAEAFGEAPRAAASAPALVPLLGDLEGTNGGPLLAIGARARVAVAVGAGEDGFLDCIAVPGRRERVDMRESAGEGWTERLSAVLREVRALGRLPEGVRVAVASDRPNDLEGALSAAFAVATARGFAALGAVKLTGRQLAGAAFRAEQGRAQSGPGVASDAVAALARRGNALLVEATSADARQVRCGGVWRLVDTGAKRSDALGFIKQRRAECAAAMSRLKLELPELVWLATWPTAWLSRLKRALQEPVRSRALHVLSEAARVRFGAQLLAASQYKRFGVLMYESHESWRRLYEASLPELDLVVHAARRAGALGARATGVGGEVLVLLGRNSATKVERAIRSALVKAYRREPVITSVQPEGGVRLERV